MAFHHRGRKSLPAGKPAAYIVARSSPCIGNAPPSSSDMLNALRKNAGSWVVKVLMLLLVASFAIWGIGDVFFGRGQNPTVATVGGAEIPANELADAFNRAVANLQRQLGPEFDRERAIQLGVMQQALQDLIGQRLISLRASEMGLVVPDDALRTLVTQDPVFQSGGQFDRSRFDQLLRASGLSEDAYLASLRQQVVRAALTGSIAGPVEAPPALVDAIYRYRNEQRRGHYVAVPVDSITDVPAPSEDELAQFHEAHQAQFTAPEYRGLTFITLEPKDLIDEIEVSDEDVEAAYQSRLEEFRTPERRTVEQLLAAEQAIIEQAAERLAAGATLEQVAQRDRGRHRGPAGRGQQGRPAGGVRAGDLQPRRGRAQRPGAQRVRLAHLPRHQDRARATVPLAEGARN